MRSYGRRRGKKEKKGGREGEIREGNGYVLERKKRGREKGARIGDKDENVLRNRGMKRMSRSRDEKGEAEEREEKECGIKMKH